LKEPFVEKFSRGKDVYGLSLKYLIERAIFCMDDNVNNGSLDIFIERRGCYSRSHTLELLQPIESNRDKMGYGR